MPTHGDLLNREWLHVNRFPVRVVTPGASAYVSVVVAVVTLFDAPAPIPGTSGFASLRSHIKSPIEGRIWDVQPQLKCDTGGAR